MPCNEWERCGIVALDMRDRERERERERERGEGERERERERERVRDNVYQKQSIMSVAACSVCMLFGR